MMPVVYFDQQNHAFAWSKMIKNAIKLFKTYFYHHAYERLTHKYEEKSFFLVFRSDSQKLVAPERFRVTVDIFFPFSTMQMNVQACVRWLKYTTDAKGWLAVF